MPDPAPFLPPVMSDVVIDLYHGNNVGSFTAAAQSGIVGAILKADQGINFDDPIFQKRMMQIVAAQLLPGAYHYFDSSDPEKQIKHFMNDVMATKIPGILRCVDFEPSPATKAIEDALAVYVLDSGNPPMLYTGRWEIPVINPILQKCEIWLAEYGSSPVCPPGWSQWKLWQHTDGQIGSAPVPVPGIGPCDRSRFAGTVDELRAGWGSPTP
jgi:lysozyme